ncbi:hypothetical protein DESC_880099 [Desulfosarcina cetonica]|nr:hypothetical protein DESC_880099 [Desulfosarcina cetonica]
MAYPEVWMDSDDGCGGDGGSAGRRRNRAYVRGSRFATARGSVGTALSGADRAPRGRGLRWQRPAFDQNRRHRQRRSVHSRIPVLHREARKSRSHPLLSTHCGPYPGNRGQPRPGRAYRHLR